MRKAVVVGVSLLTVLLAAPLGSAYTFASPTSIQGELAVTGPLEVTGSTRATAQGALLLLASTDKAPLALDLVATGSSVEVTRDSAQIVRADPLGAPLEFYLARPRSDETFGSARIVLDRVGPYAEVLFTSASDASVALSANEGSLASRGSEDLHAMRVIGSTQDTDYHLHAIVPGPHFRLDVPAADAASVKGEFRLFVFDLDFHLLFPDGTTRSYTTGRMTAGSVASTQDSVANATLVVRGGEGMLSASRGAVSLLSMTPFMMDIDGAISAADASGRLVAADGLSFSPGAAPFAMNGQVRLAPSFVPGRTERFDLALTGSASSLSPDGEPLAAQSARVAAPPGTLLAGGLGLVAVGALATVVALRLRSPGEPDDPRAGVFAMDRGDFRAALAAFDGAEPRDALGCIDRGFCLERLGKREEARAAYERAVVLDPANAEAHYYYARSLLALGVSASAIAHLSRALALDARLMEQARSDEGFRALRDHPSFLAMAG